MSEIKNQNEVPSPPKRKWYAKKRYILPLSFFVVFFLILVVAASIGSRLNKSSVAAAVPQTLVLPRASNIVTKTFQAQPAAQIISKPVTGKAVPEIPVAKSPPPVFQASASDENNSANTDDLSNDNTYQNVDGNTVHSPAYDEDNEVPAGATAQCSDGTYSFSENHRGTCSHHGGVAEWLQ